MNVNKDEKKEREVDAKKRSVGFYAAIYSCVGVMLALAALIGYNNFAGSKKTAQNDALRADATTEPGLLAVDMRGDTRVSEYIAPDEEPISANVGVPISGGSLTNTPQAAPGGPQTAPNSPPATTAKPAPTAKPTPPKTTGMNTNDAIVIPAPEDDQLGGQENFKDDDAFAAGTPVTNSDIATDDDVKGALNGTSERETLSETKTFVSFGDEDNLDWPLLGEIAMDYSKDHTIYDVTLDQFRTNETLCIAAEYGEDVRAAADGRVENFYWSQETGNNLVIDHGNGWRTTYSRLRENIPVSVGDVVFKGDVIGSVGQPPMFSVLLGTHLGFNVTKGGESVNPKDLLAKQ